MGTEVINTSNDEESEAVVISTSNGTSDQVNDLSPKSPLVDESSELRKDLWGPRLFVKSDELKGLKKSKETKEPDAKECVITSSVKDLDPNQDVLSPKKDLNCEAEKSTINEKLSFPIESNSTKKDLNCEAEKSIDNEKLNSPIESNSLKDLSCEAEKLIDNEQLNLPSKSESPKKEPNYEAEKSIKNEESHSHIKPASKHANVGIIRNNRPVKTNIIHSSEMPNKDKRSPTQISKEPMHSEHATHTDEEDASSHVSSNTASKSPKARTTVASAPNFRCSERAEKRKEFYAKLEQRQQALEAEKMQSEARTKEEHEAALKQLRKNLVFKATPMPSFYHEGPPIKHEHKKTPPTRAKSPKLGRRKSFNDATHEDKSNGGIRQQLTRQSLDSNKEIGKKFHNGPKFRNVDSKGKENSNTVKKNSNPPVDAKITEGRATDVSS